MVTQAIRMLITSGAFTEPSATSWGCKREAGFTSARVTLLVVCTHTFIIHPTLRVGTTEKQALSRIAVRIFIASHTDGKIYWYKKERQMEVRERSRIRFLHGARANIRSKYRQPSQERITQLTNCQVWEGNFQSHIFQNHNPCPFHIRRHSRCCN